MTVQDMTYSNVKLIARTVNLAICFSSAIAVACQVVRYFRGGIAQTSVLDYATVPFAIFLGTMVTEIAISSLDQYWTGGERRGFPIDKKDRT